MKTRQFLAACVSLTIFFSSSTSANKILSSSSSLSSPPPPPRVSTPFSPIVINTWPFTNATKSAWDTLQAGGSALDAVERGASRCENDRCDFSVGFGGNSAENGVPSLDAMIMCGEDMNVGSVGCLKGVKGAISVARKVMELTYHTLLVGDDATDFAVENGFRRESLQSPESAKMWAEWMQGGMVPNYRKQPSTPPSPRPPLVGHDTIGLIAIDNQGRLACGTSTNGANHKIPGRVGDSPIAGSGSYCDSEVGGAAATGDGDVMMRFLPSFAAVQYMRAGDSPTDACQKAMAPIKKFYPNAAGGIICVNRSGEYGAACIGYDQFPFSVRNEETGDVVVKTVNKF